MKIVLGTANFFQKYGISKKKINTKEIKKIFNFLKKNKIEYIDTANTYRLLKNINSKSIFKKIKVITKIKLPKKNQRLFIESIDKILKLDLDKFNQNKFESILLHNVNDIKSKNGQLFLKKFLDLKKKGLTKFLGVSIYEIKDFNFVIKKFKPDIVQFPANIFDQRFLEKNFLLRLKKNKIKSQVRSIFLQGLILNDEKSKVILKKYKQHVYLKNLDNLCKKYNINRKEACLFFIKK